MKSQCIANSMRMISYFILQLYVFQSGSQDMFTKYAKSSDKIKVYVRRVFITDDFDDMMPRYLGFVYGIVSLFICGTVQVYLYSTTCKLLFILHK